MWLAYRFPVFFLLLFASANVDLSHGTCSRHGQHVHCRTVDDIKKLKNTHDVAILKVYPIVKEITTGMLKNFPNLTHLDLSEGTLKRIELGSFSYLNNLINLNLEDNQIRNIKIGSFKGLNHLISLNLRKNEIRQLPPELLNLKSLHFVDLIGNPIECNCDTLTVRDALINKNVKISKKTLCAGPVGVKNTSIMKPEKNLVCLLDKDDKDMQMDQPTSNLDEGSGDEDDDDDDSKIFIDSEDNKKTINTTSDQDQKDVHEGSGNFDEEGSGYLEGSGVNKILSHINWTQIQEENIEENSTPSEESSSTTHNEGLFDMFWGLLWTTAAPEVKKIPELEEEQFISVTPPAIIESRNEAGDKTEKHGISFTQNAEPKPTKESDKLVNCDEDQNEQLNESLSHQTKKGLGSYIVLAALLVVLAGLIAFAAYKGDFCRSKRKQTNVEDGTELKDMQKSLLDQNPNAPKIASNGNTKIVPLIDHNDEGKNGDSRRDEVDDCDPVKPPRRSMNLDERTVTNGANYHEQILPPAYSDNNKPVSPGAQRVKITLQENPDSVPKTPVLITSRMTDNAYAYNDVRPK